MEQDKLLGSCHRNRERWTSRAKKRIVSRYYSYLSCNMWHVFAIALLNSPRHIFRIGARFTIKTHDDKLLGMIIKYIAAQRRKRVPVAPVREVERIFLSIRIRRTYFACVYIHTCTNVLKAGYTAENRFASPLRGEFRIVQTLSEIKCRHLVPGNSTALANLRKIQCTHECAFSMPYNLIFVFL